MTINGKQAVKMPDDENKILKNLKIITNNYQYHLLFMQILKQ